MAAQKEVDRDELSGRNIATNLNFGPGCEHERKK